MGTSAREKPGRRAGRAGAGAAEQEAREQEKNEPRTFFQVHYGGIAVAIVVIVVGTYFIASSFFSVYSMAVDSLFLCFLEDLERNDGTPSRPYFMSRGLQEVVGKMNQFKLLENREGQPLVQLQK